MTLFQWFLGAIVAASLNALKSGRGPPVCAAGRLWRG